MDRHLSTMSANRLNQETSPYLLQHKDNPVHWQAWGEEAFARARAENKPILLSVGYAACHWCHVMAHESFENEETARLMNELFVNIKVDREERPDLDSIYQAALALLGQQGGWPLTMFLTPGGHPFWGGTYFPPEQRWGRPGFKQVLTAIAQAYRDDPERVAKNVDSLKEALAKLARPAAGSLISPEVLDRIAERLLQEVDQRHGGIGSAPKFPQVPIFELLWRAWRRTHEERYRDAVHLTLRCMCQGGIYDHLGGGFARYATDAAWLVPHFEKMLYDNAALLDLLALAWRESHDPLYEQRIREIAQWVLREMRAEAVDGRRGFASALDADSEGEEGKFYVWQEAEIDEVLGADSALFKQHYDVRPEGNWEGRTILNRSARPEIADEATEKRLALCRAKLLERREGRVRPGFDDKVLADWNGLMIAALARAGALMGEKAWVAAAREAFEFVSREMSREGRLAHSWRKGRARHPATLDDYANMARAALALGEACAETGFIARAEAFVALLDAHYWDEEGGGYFFTADDTSDVILRNKSAIDHAAPPGNATMIEVLARLYYLTGKNAYLDRAQALVSAFAGEIGRNFFPLASFINAQEFLQKATQVVIVGEPDGADTALLLQEVRSRSLPDLVLTTLPATSSLPEGHPAHGKVQARLKNGSAGTATAYVCRAMTCSLPITEAAGLAVALDHV
jgi:uncharacterized protein